MSHTWTDAQLNAIGLRGCDILVSAAAGSGKTAALTERIIRSLTREDSPADITRLLAVTFTRAAAAELRRRISSALSERLSKDPGNRRLVRQLMLLGSAKICTIDSFYNDIVKSNFQRLSLPAGFRIADDAELSLLQKSLMETLIDTSYTEGDAGFLRIAENFSTNKSDAALSEFLIDIYEAVRKFPEGVSALSKSAEILRNEADAEFFNTRSGRLIADELLRELEYFKSFYHYALSSFTDEKVAAAYYAAFESDSDFISSLIDAVNGRNYAAARNAINAFAPAGLKGLKAPNKTPETESLKDRRSIIKDRIREIAKIYFSQSCETISAAFIGTASICDDLYNFISRYEKDLSEEKLRRGICDFEDIRRYTLTLLVNPDGSPTDIALSWGARFDEIFIDEYQDVDEIQDMIFRAISGNATRFMVGDIKQSIYGFRGAEPSLFASYRADFPPYDLSPDAPLPEFEAGEGRSVFMSNNFRCDETVIDFTNEVCRKILTACGASVNYLPEDDLIFSKTMPDGSTPRQVSVTVIKHDDEEGNSEAVFDNDGDEDASAPSEIKFVSAEISRLLSGEKKADGKPIEPGDIAVLCRSKSTCRAIAEELRRLGIPTVNDGGSDYLSDPGVSLVISLLTVIDNPQKDIPLAAVLRSPFFGFTMDELTRIRRRAPKSTSLYDAVSLAADSDFNYSEKCRAFCQRLDAYRALARSLPADRLMRHILRDTSALSIAEGENGESDIGRRRLLRLYEYARQFEAGSFRGLYNFIKYLRGVIESDAEIGNDGAEIGSAAVTVITIHHSKGLEFPVCFVCGCGKSFNFGKESKSDFLPNRAYGPAARLRDSTGLAKISTPIFRASLLDSTRRQVEEEMRLFYVALTRARERLYLTSFYRFKLEKKLDDAYYKQVCAGDYGALSAKSYLDWLLLTLDLSPAPDAPYTFDIIAESQVPSPIPYVKAAQAAERSLSESEIEELEVTLDERFAYKYPYSHLTRLPAKLSVSRLYPEVLDEDEVGEAIEAESGEKIDRESIIKKLAMPSFMSKDDAVSEADFAERGTATHVFLQFCDYGRCTEHGVDEEISYLVEKKFISPRIAALVDRGQLEGFFSSEFFGRLRSARWLRREQRFNVLLPAENFSGNPEFKEELEGEELLVQGVIDLFFEDADGRIVLCDYKTDRLTRAELSDHALAAKKLSERHALQLSYYASALEKICGKRPDDILIYSLPLGDVIEVNL